MSKRNFDIAGLKEGGKITHYIDSASAAKIGLAMFTSSLLILIIGHIITAFKSKN